MMDSKRMGQVALMVGMVGLFIMVGCISPGSNDPFDGYYTHLQSSPDHLIRVATKYNPDFTPEEKRDAARHYGLYPGSPANVGRWADLMVVVYGGADASHENGNDQESRDSANGGDEGPLCDQVQLGSVLEMDPDLAWKRYCLSLDRDEHGRTYFFLPADETYFVGFGIQGSASERAADDREDCRGPMYWSGDDARAPSVEAEPIPGRIAIHENKDVILHFGILCML